MGTSVWTEEFVFTRPHNNDKSICRKFASIFDSIGFFRPFNQWNGIRSLSQNTLQSYLVHKLPTLNIPMSQILDTTYDSFQTASPRFNWMRLDQSVRDQAFSQREKD